MKGACYATSHYPYRIMSLGRSEAHLGGILVAVDTAATAIEITPSVLAVPRWMAFFVSLDTLGHERDACGPFLSVRMRSPFRRSDGASEKEEVFYAEESSVCFQFDPLDVP
jgi:hypothetical protein